MSLFSLFRKKKPADRKEGVRIYFDKDAIYFSQINRLEISKGKNQGTEVIPFAIIEPFGPHRLNELTVQMIFDEAERQGFDPVSIVSFNGQYLREVDTTATKFPVSNGLTVINPMDRIEGSERPKVCWMFEVIASNQVDAAASTGYIRPVSFKEVPDDLVLVNPTTMRLMESAIRKELVIPISLCHVEKDSGRLTDPDLDFSGMAEHLANVEGLDPFATIGYGDRRVMQTAAVVRNVPATSNFEPFPDLPNTGGLIVHRARVASDNHDDHPRGQLSPEDADKFRSPVSTGFNAAPVVTKPGVDDSASATDASAEAVDLPPTVRVVSANATKAGSDAPSVIRNPRDRRPTAEDQVLGEALGNPGKQ